MRKIVVTIVVVAGLLWGADAYFRHWTTQRLEATIKYAYPNTKVDVKLGGYITQSGGKGLIAKPILPSLIFLHKVNDVSVHMSGDLHMGQLPIDDFTFVADSLKLDNAQLFDAKRTVVSEASGGEINMQISDTSLSLLRPDLHVIIDGSDNATVNTANGRQKLDVNVTDTSIDFSSGGVVLASVSTVDNSFLPCKPEASFGSHAFYLSCPTPKVPIAIAGANG